jgi:4-amino-4-deoxy-L-arabinose transferase-like glycosyltransferase
VNGGRRRALWEWALVVLLLLVAFWFRTYRLPDVPPGLHHDDVKNILLVEKIVGGYLRIYYPENYGHEPLYHWLQALYAVLLGLKYPEVRLLSVGISMAGLAIVYVLVKRLLGRSVALWTLAWQCVSLWPLFYSRRAIRGVLLPPLAALTGYLFVAGLDGGHRPWKWRWSTWILGGLSLAACLYTYMGSRVLPLFFALLVLYLALVERQRLVRHWPGIVLFFGVALLLSLPLGSYLISHPEERIGQIGAPLRALQQGEWRPLLENSLRALGMFTFTGDPYWRQFVADTPVFEPLGALLFYGGLVLAAWRWRRFEHVFFLLWLPVTLAPAMFSEGAPNFLRPIAAQVAAYVFPASAIGWALGRLRARPRPALAWAAAACSVAILGFNAWRTYDGYFVRWPQHPDARFAYNATLLDEARYLDGARDVHSAVMSGHFPADLDPTLVGSVLRRQDIRPRWCDIRQALVYPAGQDTIVFQPDYFPIDPVLLEAFFAGQSPVYERRMPDGTFVFALYSLPAAPLTQRLDALAGHPVGWSQAATFPGGLPGDWSELSWPVTFDQKVEFIGYEILDGEQAAAGGTISLLTYWRPLQAGSASSVTFVHLLSAEGSVVSAYDGFGAPPNRWVGGDVIVQVHRLGLPADLQPGTYPIELGWYERDSGARWQAALPGGEQADRLLLSPVTVR